MKRINYFLPLCILIFFGCQSAKENNQVIQFENRSIDISPFFKEFPYSQFAISNNGEKLYFFRNDTTQSLQWIDIKPGQDIRQATSVTNLDFSKRNCWHPVFNEKDGYFYWIGDERNEEIINIYRTKPGSNQTEKLTDVPYIYAWDLSPDGNRIAYVARMGQNEQRLDNLHVLDLTSMKDSLICADDADFRFTWGNVAWSPDGKNVAVLSLKDMDRTYTNVSVISLETGQKKVVTDPDKPGSLLGTSVPQEWLSNNQLVFISDQDGFSNLYIYDIQSQRTEQLTKSKHDFKDFRLITIDGTQYILALMSNPIRSTIMLIDPITKGEVIKKDFDLSLQFGTIKDQYALLLAEGTTTPFKILKVGISKENIHEETVMQTPDEVEKELVQSTAERLEIPTFDVDSTTGKQRMIHAYLYKPLNPLPAEKQLLMVESFYGGENRFSAEYQIFAKAGIYVLSASPRGSDGFGRDFAAMNDHDLGGNETIDMIYVSQYVARKLGIPENRVGVFGMSHGGYETMRLMTFPGEVNGVKAHFPFGFGIETAGFCDIIRQHHTSNIPDWTALEAGDPVKDSLKLMDRSPITHADKISGPLLLIHGDHDNRVNIIGSSLMADKLKELGKPYEFVIFPGLGHGIKGSDNNLKYYSACFKFMEDYVLKEKK